MTFQLIIYQTGTSWQMIMQDYAAIDGLDAAESLDLLLAKLSLRRSRCSFNRLASSFWYSAASALAFAILFFLSAILALFLCNVKGVTNLWILGALLAFLPVNIKPQHHYSSKKFNQFLIKHEIEHCNLTSFSCKISAICVDIFAHIIVLGKIKQFPDLWSPFRPSHSRLLDVSQSRKIILTLLHNNQVKNREVWTHNATPNRLPSPLSIPSSITTEAWSSWSIKNTMCQHLNKTIGNKMQIMHKALTSVKQETNTSRSQHSLLHGKTLLVTSPSYLENITLKLLQVINKITINQTMYSISKKEKFQTQDNNLPPQEHLHWLLGISFYPKMPGCHCIMFKPCQSSKLE